MSPSAFVLGGTGLIGRALVPQLLDRGYDVTVGSRTPAPLPQGAGHVIVDRNRDPRLDAIDGDFEVFIDIVAFERRHAEQLSVLAGRVGSLVVISSAAVYADEEGRPLLGSEVEDAGLIDESRPVVPAVDDGSDYAGGKVAVETQLLDSQPGPVTILRPGAIFGPGDRASREWHFVKRALDDRRAVVLAYGGDGIFHPVSSANVASMVVSAAENPGTGIVNCGDPDPRSVREICEAITNVMKHSWNIHTIDGPPEGHVGDTPWSTSHSFVLDLTVARDELGFTGDMVYDVAIEETCQWLVDATRDRPWEQVLPRAAHFYPDQFDYEAEDRFLERKRRQ